MAGPAVKMLKKAPLAGLFFFGPGPCGVTRYRKHGRKGKAGSTVKKWGSER